MTFSGVLSIPKTTTKANQRSYRISEKERAHHKWDTDNEIASLHNKNDERDDGYQNDGIDASSEENIVSDDSMMGPLHARSRTLDHPLHLSLLRIQRSPDSTFFPRKEFYEFDLHPTRQPWITRRNRVRWTYSTNELNQQPHSLIPGSQYALLDPATPLRDEGVERPSRKQDDEPGECAPAYESSDCFYVSSWMREGQNLLVQAIRISNGAALVVCQ